MFCADTSIVVAYYCSEEKSSGLYDPRGSNKRSNKKSTLTAVNLGNLKAVPNFDYPIIQPSNNSPLVNKSIYP